MAGSRNWHGRLCLLALGAVGLALMQAGPVVAQAPQATQAEAKKRADVQAVWRGLERRWESLREDLTRTALETALTMFFIRWTPPPPPPPPAKPLVVVPPPQGQGNQPPPGSNDPPPPGGQGDPPLDVNPPPQTAPEPAGIVIALMGTGLAAGYGWHRRRKAGRTA